MATLGYPLQGQGLINQSGFAGQTAFAQQGFAQQGFVGAQPGLIGQPGLVGQPLIGQQNFAAQPLVGTTSVVGGVPAVGFSGVQQAVGQSLIGGTPYGAIGTTNQFVPGNGYNQGCLNCCPWWLWLILGALLLGGLIAGLVTAFSGKTGRHSRKSKRTTTSTEVKTGAGNDASASGDNAGDASTSTSTTTTTNTGATEGEGAAATEGADAKAESHHLRYSISEWM